MSDAFRLLLVRVAAEKALPLKPNAETIAAMKAARRGEFKRYAVRGDVGVPFELHWRV